MALGPGAWRSSSNSTQACGDASTAGVRTLPGPPRGRGPPGRIRSTLGPPRHGRRTSRGRCWPCRLGGRRAGTASRRSRRPAPGPGQHRDQLTAAPTGRGDVLIGGPQPLAGPVGGGEQERLPERLGARRAAAIGLPATAGHRHVSLHEQRRHEDVHSIEITCRADDRAAPQLLGHDGAAPVGVGDDVHEHRLGQDVRRLQPQPTHLRSVAGAATVRLGKQPVKGVPTDQLLRLRRERIGFVVEVGRPGLASSACTRASSFSSVDDAPRDVPEVPGAGRTGGNCGS